MKRFYITGISCTGKSSIALKLKEKGIPSIDIDEIKGLCHWVNKKTKKVSYWHSGIGSEFLETINKRINNDFGKHHSEQKMLLDWYMEFKRKMIKRGAVPINTSAPLNVVFNKVIKHIYYD